jgi:hypothetical protein
VSPAGGAPATSPDVVLTALADGTGVLLHLGTKFYYTLNRTGVVAWQAMAAGTPAEPDALVDVLAERFSGLERERARQDVRALLEELAAEGLLAAGP